MLMFILGFFSGILTLVLWTGYHYYKAMKQAHDEGWDMPN